MKFSLRELSEPLLLNLTQKLFFKLFVAAMAHILLSLPDKSNNFFATFFRLDT
ncbi:hypothetical protein XBKQ1_2380021 [Xenorhabdus bovienii str. kraussei Quebec]|uniref:Rho-GAP domain-containing protein n=1 Tax=Xenorhabdus bovienii str. kraussei Quebec TaxID=1398203 RepID=A0A077PH34_XENBV|nr:hypothetical protein XBKQ1_2380021 [Xenorhabdus bovienii str. kraussei Quebec]